jgi:integrase
MPRKLRDRQLDTRESRGRLAVRGKPYWRTIEQGTHLGYRRIGGRAGSWCTRHYLGEQRYEVEGLGIADDQSDADGLTILNFWQAVDKARERAVSRAKAAAGITDPVTVAAALEQYRHDLETRGADVSNVARVQLHMSEELAGKLVGELTADDLKIWRNKLRKKQSAASVNRTAAPFRAALNYAADHDSRMHNRGEWKIGLKCLPDADRSRNVILAEPKVLAIVAEAYRENMEFGLLIETAAVTGARFSQLGRIEVRDLQCDRDNPRIMMPSSKKGGGVKKIVRRPVPITPDLAARLRRSAANRSGTAPLLVKPSGEPWKKSDQTLPFKRSASRAGLDPEVSMYALRHTSIVRQLQANVPIRVVAVNHDTSVVMIEKTYSAHIGDHTDMITRAALLDTGVVINPAANIVPMARRP